jgi:hypothetical protein
LKDKDFLVKRINELIDKLSDESLLAELLELQAICFQFIESKKEQANAFADEEKVVSLEDFINKQGNQQDYLNTLSRAKELLFKGASQNLIGKRFNPPNADLKGAVAMERVLQEERKEPQSTNGVKPRGGTSSDPELSQEDMELIKVYGPRIRVIKWYFENDKVVKEALNKEQMGMSPRSKLGVGLKSNLPK